MGGKNSSVYSKFVTKMIFIVLISVGLWYLVFIYGEYYTFRSESKALRSMYIQSNKLMLKTQVASVAEYINTMRNKSEADMHKILRQRVDNAYETAMNIYRRNIVIRTRPEIVNMIKDALSPIRFDNGRGYYFAVSMDGVQQLNPLKPVLEGQKIIDFKDANGNFIIHDEIKVIKEAKQGFINSFGIIPGEDTSEMRRELSFIRYFKPLDWYIGTSIYLSCFEEQVKNEVVNRIVNLRFGKEGYFFGLTYKGDFLFTDGKIKKGSDNTEALKDADEKKIIEGMREIVHKHEEGFIRYSWNKLKAADPSPKMSFVKGLPNWKWIIGAGVYLDSVDKMILEKKAALQKKLKYSFIRGIFILLLLSCLIYWWSKRLADQISESVDTCLSCLMQASSNSMQVDLKDIKFKEFREIAVEINNILEQRQQAETKLMESEEKYRSIFENAVEGFFQRTPDGSFININNAFASIVGYSSPEELISTVNDLTTQLYVNPDDRHRYEKLIRENGYIKNFELQAKHKNGSHVWVSSTANVVYDKNGEIIRYEGSIVDITERKKAEADHKRLLAAIENAFEIIVITDTAGSIFYVNPSFEKITGYTKKEVVGKNPNILKSGKQDRKFYFKLWQTITSGSVWHGRLVNRKKNGTLYTEEASISPVFDESGEIVNFVAVKRDITDEIMMEKKMQQSQKMESIGVLAGGIAHDFNNILFPIMGYTEMMMQEISGDNPWSEDLHAIYKSCLRAMDLVKQILTFARQDKSEMKLMKMQPIIKEALKLIRATIPATINIKQNISPKCGPIKADPTQIHQIIMNLTTNAFHAMEDTGGDMEILLEEMHLDHDYALNHKMESGEYACLTVSDTGTGIDKEIIKNIFDPFFTTKDKGKGTGMGLSVVHGIVTNAGGSINVYSEPGTGTTFNVYLPVVNNDSGEQTMEIKPPLKRGSGHILLIDDEKEVVKMEKNMLERLGYNVTSRTSSIEALELFKKSTKKFDLVITDMSMPNISGDKLSVEMIRLRSDIPILLCTGFHESMSEKKAASLGIKGYLYKPVMIQDLSDKIYEILYGTTTPLSQ